MKDKRLRLIPKTSAAQRVVKIWGSMWSIEKELKDKFLARSANRMNHRYIMKDNDTNFFIEIL